MEINVVLTKRELDFLNKMISEMGALGRPAFTIADAVHQCIAMAMYEESEEA